MWLKCRVRVRIRVTIRLRVMVRGTVRVFFVPKAPFTEPTAVQLPPQMTEWCAQPRQRVRINLWVLRADNCIWSGVDRCV